MKKFENYLRKGWKGLLLALIFTPFLIAAQPTDEQIQQSIEDGVTWLVAQQTVDGYWLGYGNPEAGTGLALYKLCERAYELGYESPFVEEYPYHQNVIDGFDWLFNQLYVVEINAQDHSSWVTGNPNDDPDENGNGTGVCARYNASYETYTTGILLTAISASGTPARVVDVAGSPVDRWTYFDVAQDMVDFLAWGQVEGVDYMGNVKEGGWDYSHVNNGVGGSSWKGDQSNSGYATLGLAEAQKFGCTIPDWVKTSLSWWIDFVQDDIDEPELSKDKDGGSWYGFPNDGIGINTLKTGNLIMQMALCGDTPETQRAMDAVDYLVRHWGDASGTNQPPGWDGDPAQYQAMFCIMKGLVFMGIDEINGTDWFVDFATAIVEQQDATGAWLLSSGRGEPVIVTEWALLTLEKIAPPPPVVYVDLDVHPTSWPNPINVASKGKTPMAILGTEAFDVYNIDPSSLYLDLPEGMVYPLTWAYEDVTMPAGNEWECNDTEEGPDGYMDLTLKFKTQELVAALGDVSDGDELVIVIKGMLMDEQDLEGDDCIWIIDNTDKAAEAGIQGQLSQNYPNPFSYMTAINFTLDEPSYVTLKVYDLLGNEVAILADRYFAEGTHRLEFEPMGLSGGMYIYRLQTDDGMATRRMLYHQ